MKKAVDGCLNGQGQREGEQRPESDEIDYEQVDLDSGGSKKPEEAEEEIDYGALDLDSDPPKENKKAPSSDSEHSDSPLNNILDDLHQTLKGNEDQGHHQNDAKQWQRSFPWDR